MKKCYFLIGLPGVGKSTIVKQIQEQEENSVYLSTDAFLEQKAKEHSISYYRAWRDFGEESQKKMSTLLQHSIKEGATLIWDQTNTLKIPRVKKVRRLKENKYNVIGLNFEISDAEWMRRIEQREVVCPRDIKPDVLQEMKDSYQRASYDEGFDEIYLINEMGELNLMPNPNLIKSKNKLK